MNATTTVERPIWLVGWRFPALCARMASATERAIPKGHALPALRSHGIFAALLVGLYLGAVPAPSLAGEAQVSAGVYHTCVLLSDGSPACWGRNNYGQVSPPAGSFVQVSAGNYHNCALRSNGTLACWGRDNSDEATPPAGTFTQVSAGNYFTCAVRSNGSLACWGRNSDGQATPPTGSFTQVSAGSQHACAVRSNGSLACWGDNSPYDQATPPFGGFLQVGAGKYHSCGLRVDATLACWGRNSHDQATPPAGSFTRLSAGYWHNCAVRSDGSLACWGWDDNGEYAAPAGSFPQVSAGDEHSCAVRSDETLACWGDDEYGKAPPPLALSPSILSQPTLGTPYSQPLGASGGAAPYSFAVIAGGLPPGLSLAADGLLSGTPTAAGSYDFTVQVTDIWPIPLAGERAYTFAMSPIWPADAAAQSNQDWIFVDAASGYLDAVVIAGPPTYHGPDPGVVRLQHVTDLGFELRFQEWDYRKRDFADSYHALEDIPYAVLQPGRYTLSDGSEWEVGTFDLGGTGAWQGVLFTQPFVNPPHLFLTVQTYNGNQAVSVRARDVTVDGFEAAFFEEEALMDGHLTETVAYLAIDSPTGGGLIELDGVEYPYLLQSLKGDERWSPALSQRLKVEEEKSLDAEVVHTDETLHVLALDNQVFAQQVSDNGADTSSLRRLAPTKDAPMEWGMIRGIDHNWQTLPFAKTYSDPVLVVKPASNNGGDPGVIRLKDITATDAQLRYQEWNYLDGNHGAPEDVFYLVCEAGEHSLGGLTVEADWLVTNRLGRDGQWEGIGFNAVFSPPPSGPPAPVVLTAVMTYAGSDAVTTRIDSLDLTGFDLAMDEQESKADGHVNETLGWIAIQTGTGTTAEGRSLEVFFEQLDHSLTPVIYSSPTSQRYPTVLGDVGSTYGADPVSLRYANPMNAQIELKLTEEQSADTETTHTTEDVGIFVGE